MPRIKAVAIAIGMAFLLASPAAFAGTGKLKIVLKDSSGFAINGKVTVKRGTTVKTCTTAAGTCSISNLTAGDWTVSAKTLTGTKTGGPKIGKVITGKTVIVTLLVKNKSTR